ncbi:hypothetical protein [Nocardia cyriacigeorgica]|uniref:glycine-rich domain-containing protein n=1 Tax=Nocardia cyriacigeorgica TaxID=135487 RepID=UPI002456FEDC|nr:hypothetical protein [Nocardia cyriacigeorgica]
MSVFTANGTWTQPARLLRIDVLVRGAGGSGSSTIGGGGGAAVLVEHIRPADLAETVAITVGHGGTAGGDGGDSLFGDYIRAPGGRGGLAGGEGGMVAGMRGGNGGTAGQPGQSVTSAPRQLLAAGGGGAGSSSTGGRSGLVPANTSHPIYWEWLQSGGGGHAGQPGGFPSGGGGANAPGAGGCVSILEYIQEV